MTFAALLGARFRRMLPVGAFGRGVAVLAGGTAMGQAIAVLASPLLTRLYTPADFGLLGIYTAAIGILGSLGSFSYHQAIPLPEDDATAAEVLVVAALSTLALAAGTAILVWFFGDVLIRLLRAQALDRWLWMVPLGVLGLGVYEILAQWAVRRKSFSKIARTSVARGVGQTGTQLGFGALGVGPVGLLLGQLLGQWLGSGSLLLLDLRESWHLLLRVRPVGLLAVARRYVHFPAYAAPAALLNTLGVNAPPLLLAAFFGSHVVGLYALAQRCLMMPVTLVAKSAAQVFFSSAAESHRRGALGEATLRIVSQMNELGLPFALILIVCAPATFAVTFGSEWREAGVYAQWLTVWLLLVFVTMPVAPVIAALEFQRTGAFFQGGQTVVRIAALGLGAYLGSGRAAVILFGAASAVTWLAFLVWILHIAGVAKGAALKAFGAALPRAALVAAPALLARVSNLGDVMTLVGGGVGVLAASIDLLGRWPGHGMARSEDATRGRAAEAPEER